MTRTHKITSLLAALALALVSAPAVAQEESPAAADMAAPTIAVSGVDYAFVGLPTSVPAGTTITFQNEGTEIHEMAVIHILDETSSLEELMAMPEEESAALAEFVGFVSAMPGNAATDSIVLDAPGRYIAACFLNQGMDPAAFEAAGVDLTQVDENTDPGTMPAEAQALFESLQANPTHMDLGMIQEFTVTEAGTEVGPLPESSAEVSEPADEEAAPESEESSSE